MNGMEIWHNPRCSKSRAAKQRLDDNNIEYTERRYLDDAPTADELDHVLELLNKVGKATPERAGEVIVDHLAAQRDASRQWIDDLRLREVLSTAPVALSLPRYRLEMVLESLENAMRSPLRAGRRERAAHSPPRR